MSFIIVWRQIARRVENKQNQRDFFSYSLQNLWGYVLKTTLNYYVFCHGIRKFIGQYCVQCKSKCKPMQTILLNIITLMKYIACMSIVITADA